MFKSKFAGMLTLIGMFVIGCGLPTKIFSQAPLSEATAQLMVMGRNSGGQPSFITINGTNSINGAPLSSPAKILVPPDTTATIDFGKAGKLDLAPGTEVNLTFDTAGASIDLDQGRLQITCAPQFGFNIKTVDGIIANDKNRSTVFTTEIIGGSTGVSTSSGIALVNGVPVRAGEVWTADPAKKALLTKSPIIKRESRKSKLWLVGLGAAIGAGAIITAVIVKNN